MRLQKSTGEKLETRTAMITLISRTIGVHKLLLLNFYPFLQRYLQPHQRDVTTLLAALIQASTCPVTFSGPHSIVLKSESFSSSAMRLLWAFLRW